MSRWFRMYDEMLDDPKVQMLAPELFKTWVNILALASRRGGALHAVTEVAFALRMSVGDTQAHIDELVRTGLLDIRDDNGVEPHNWWKRQWKGDDSADRVRRHRARKKRECNEHVTGGVTVTVTPPDTETDTDTEDSEVKSQPATKVETEAACVRADLSEAEQALDEMISSIRSWGNGMNIVEARTWLSTTVRTYGQRPTARAYHQLKTELQTGQLIGHPLRAWGSIAERFRAEDAERKAAKDAPPKLSKTREAINRRLAKQAALAAELEAKPHG